MPTIYGVLEKRKWAEHHLKLIEQSIGDFFNSDPYPIMSDGDPENGVYHACLVYPKKLSVRDLSLMIGDCVHNMRSALDYIAWELAGASLTDTETMFPIYETDVGFRKNGLRRIRNVRPDEAKTLIERLQPYNTRYGGHVLALAAINKIDASDKHKLLTIALAMAEQVTCRHGLPGHIRYKGQTNLRIYPSVRLIHGAKIATFTVIPPIREMEVEF